MDCEVLALFVFKVNTGPSHCLKCTVVIEMVEVKQQEINKKKVSNLRLLMRLVKKGIYLQYKGIEQGG